MATEQVHRSAVSTSPPSIAHEPSLSFENSQILNLADGQHVEASSSAVEVDAGTLDSLSSTVNMINTLFDNSISAHFEDEDEEGEWGDEEEFDEEDYLDAEAEAEKMARQLGDQIMAQIGLVFGTAATSQDVPAEPVPIEEPPPPDPLVATIQSILQHASSSPEIKSALDETIVPGSDGANLFTVLTNVAASGDADPDLAESLSELISAIAATIGDDAPAEDPAPRKSKKKGKRKRANTDDGKRDGKPAAPAPSTSTKPLPANSQPGSSAKPAAPPAQPPPTTSHSRVDLNSQLSNAISVITRALEQSGSQSASLDPSLIASIQAQLYQVFLFAATSAGVGGGHEMAILQEISGLIQVLGVISGVQIAPTPILPHVQYPTAYQYPYATMYHTPMWPHHPPNDTGTAVFPCNYPGCGKTFARLMSLRGHQQIHAADRPYRCTLCPTAFARNHDLQRHIRSHGTRLYKCGGCDGTFSRRDALKRHKTNTKNSHPGCASSPIEVIDVVDPGDVKGRRSRPGATTGAGAGAGAGAGTGTAATASATATTTAASAVTRATEPTHYGMDLEEGELPPQAVAQAQTAVTHLHSLLQSRVAQALGGSHEQGNPTTTGAASSSSSSSQGGQTTTTPAGGWGALAALVGRSTTQFAQPPLPFQLQSQQTAQIALPSQPGSKTAAAATKTETNTTPPTAGSDTPALTASDPPPITIPSTSTTTGSMAGFGLNEEQTHLLELAIAIAAEAAQAQAEKEARMEEELEMAMDEDGEYEEEEEYEEEDEQSAFEQVPGGGYVGNGVHLDVDVVDAPGDEGLLEEAKDDGLAIVASGDVPEG